MGSWVRKQKHKLSEFYKNTTIHIRIHSISFHSLFLVVEFFFPPLFIGHQAKFLLVGSLTVCYIAITKNKNIQLFYNLDLTTKHWTVPLLHIFFIYEIYWSWILIHDRIACDWFSSVLTLAPCKIKVKMNNLVLDFFNFFCILRDT